MIRAYLALLLGGWMFRKISRRIESRRQRHAS
jgi:hypothetical protein